MDSISRSIVSTYDPESIPYTSLIPAPPGGKERVKMIIPMIEIIRVESCNFIQVFNFILYLKL